MAAVTPVSRPRTSAKPQERRANLRVVRTNERVRVVGAVGTFVGAILMTTLLLLAGLHAVLVQTQAKLDSLDTEIAGLEVQRNEALAELAWHDSPEGLAESAAAAGFVHATDLKVLAPVAEGSLLPPAGLDPFGGVGG